MAEEGLTLDQMRVHRMAESRFADLMANAGVDSGTMARELLFFLPRDFVTAYSEVFYAAFGGKDDGGVGARGEANAAKAELGKASGKGLAGLGGAKRKAYKKHWVIADEAAVELKDKTDKRLRAMARELRVRLSEDGVHKVGEESKRASCSGCKRFMEMTWTFCPSCGSRAIE